MIGASAAITASFYSTMAATLVSVNSARQQARASRSIARRNAAIARQRVVDARLRGGAAELRKRRQIHRLLGAQRAAGGASGAQIESGSLQRLQDDVVTLGELDVMTIRNNASREALGLETQAQNFLFEGDLGARAGELGAVSQGLQGIAQGFGIFAAGR